MLRATLNGVQGFMDAAYSWELRIGIDPVSQVFQCPRDDALGLIAQPWETTLTLEQGGDSYEVGSDTIQFQGLHVGELPPDRSRYDETFALGELEILDARFHLRFGSCGRREFNWKTRDFRRARTGEYEQFYYRRDTLNPATRDAWTFSEILGWIESSWTGADRHETWFKAHPWKVNLSEAVGGIIISDATLQGSPAECLGQLFGMKEIAGRAICYLDQAGDFHIVDQPPILAEALDPTASYTSTMGMIQRQSKRPHRVSVAFPVLRRELIKYWETVIPVDLAYTDSDTGISYQPGDWAPLYSVGKQWFYRSGSSTMGSLEGSGQAGDAYATTTLPAGSDPTTVVRDLILLGSEYLMPYLRYATGMTSPVADPDLERLARLRAKLLEEHAWLSFRPYNLTHLGYWWGIGNRLAFGVGKYYTKNKYGFGYTNFTDELKVERIDRDPWNLSGYIDQRIEMVDPEQLVVHIHGEPEQRFQHTLKSTSITRMIGGNLFWEGYASLWITLYLWQQPSNLGDMHVVEAYEVPDTPDENGTEYVVVDTQAIFGRVRQIENQIINKEELNAVVEAEAKRAELRYRPQYTGVATYEGIRQPGDIQGEMGQIKSLRWVVTGDGSMTEVEWLNMQPETPFYRTSRQQWQLQRAVWDQMHLHRP